MRGFSKLTGWTAGLLGAIGGLAIVLMMFHIVADVIGKYVFNAPVRGTLETVAGYYMVMCIYLPLAYVAREGHHIQVELFTRNLTGRGLARLMAGVGTLTFLYLAALTWKATEEAIDKTIQGEVWETSGTMLALWPSRWVLALGVAIMALWVLIGIGRDLKRAFGRA